MIDAPIPTNLTGSTGFRQEIIARTRRAIGERTGFVPLHEPEFSGAEWAMVKDCLDTGWVSSVGGYVDRFERDIAAACGVDYGVGIVNGTAALHLAFRVVGVQPGDEVLLPALTFVATANAITQAGAVPHFVDSAMSDLGLDTAALAQYLDDVAEMRGPHLINQRTGARITAIVPMHVFGHPVDMDALLGISDEYGLTVVEDAAEALGSTYNGQRCGGLGRIAALSFNGNKILTTGGGGAIVTNDPQLAQRAKHLSTTAKLPHRWAFDHDDFAYNYRMPNINAALGCAQLEQLDDRLARKRRLAQQYFSSFEGFVGASIFQEPAKCKSNFWLNTLILDEEISNERDALLDDLNDSGLMSRPIWSLLHRNPFYANCQRAPLPNAEALEQRIVNLPSSAGLSAK